MIELKFEAWGSLRNKATPTLIAWSPAHCGDSDNLRLRSRLQPRSFTQRRVESFEDRKIVALNPRQLCLSGPGARRRASARSCSRDC
jgi:hypothetical protein